MTRAAHRIAPHPASNVATGGRPLLALPQFRALLAIAPVDSVPVEGSPANLGDLHAA